MQSAGVEGVSLCSFVAFLWEIWKALPVIRTVGSRIQLFLGTAIPDSQ